MTLHRPRPRARELGDVSLVVRAVLDPVINQAQGALRDLNDQWHPSGFYTPTQILMIASHLNQLQKMVIAPIDGYLGMANSAQVAAGAALIGPYGALSVPGTLAAKTARAVAQRLRDDVTPGVTRSFYAGGRRRGMVGPRAGAAWRSSARRSSP